jgi:hypothetical protein
MVVIHAGHRADEYDRTVLSGRDDEIMQNENETGSKAVVELVEGMW